MKSKKLLVSLAIVAVVVVIIVVMASVFSFRDNGYFIYHKFDGNLTTAPDGGVPEDVIANIAKGKSTIFLSKTNFLAQLNAQLRANYPQWHAFAVVKSFPNILEVHLVKVTAIAKLKLATGDEIYLDSFGCVTEAPDYDCIDITKAFILRNSAEPDANGMFRFESSVDNERLDYVLKAILATWQCYVEVDQMNIVLNADTPFEFDNSDGSMLIHPRQGGTIRLLSPKTDLSSRLQKAYGVYYNSSVNLQGDDWEITVLENGKIKTHDPNK